ncbi:MAG: DinB family protein [Flavobacteriaceae bacterium]|nr:DinB family protein [Flavobacteriaceae bacterium]
MTTHVLAQNEFGEYYAKYIALATDDDIITGLEKNRDMTLKFIGSLTEAQLNYAYAEGKWTIKEILVHLIDSERVFSYRALRFARFDNTNLPGYEHNDYVVQSDANIRSIEAIMEEYKAVRNATIALFKNLNDKALQFIGTANGSPISVRALGFIIIGHERHHSSIIRERYL